MLAGSGGLFAYMGHKDATLIERLAREGDPKAKLIQDAMAYQISKLPYGVLIDSKGQVTAHGLINNREHIESLFEAFRAADTGEDNVTQLAG